MARSQIFTAAIVLIKNAMARMGAKWNDDLGMEAAFGELPLERDSSFVGISLGLCTHCEPVHTTSITHGGIQLAAFTVWRVDTCDTESVCQIGGTLSRTSPPA